MNSSLFPDDDVDPEIREWLTQMFAASARLGASPDTPIQKLRAIAEIQRQPWREGGPVMHETTDLQVGHGIPIRIYRPCKADAQPALVYLHGGGWTLFSVDTHDRLMREYAAGAGVAVIGVDYRLAPEHRFPAALDDVGMVLDWLHREGEAHHLDTSAYAVGGDSAGANLAIASAIRRRDLGRPQAAALLLNYGVYDCAQQTSYARYGNGDRYMLTGAEMQAFWQSYLGPDQIGDSRVYPLRADLHGLPPAWLCAAQCDILVDENIEMAKRLLAAGNEAELRIYGGATHSFLEAMAISQVARNAIQHASAWLSAKLALGQGPFPG